MGGWGHTSIQNEGDEVNKSMVKQNKVSPEENRVSRGGGVETCLTL